jgi:hypothetical protein
VAHQRALMRSIPSFLEAATTAGRGPRPSFTRAHLLLVFLIIGARGRVGRQALAHEAGLGEGATRTVLKKLLEGGYAEIDASGAHFTRKGIGIHSQLKRELSPIHTVGSSRLTVGIQQVAIGARGRGRRIGNGILQRDSAIMEGATGATTYAIKGSRFTIPGGSQDCERDFPSEAWKPLRKEIAPRNGDAVILCGAQEEITARLGALSAALTLL